MRPLDIPTLPGIDYTQGVALFGIGAIAGLIGYGFTLFRIGRESDKPWLASFGATGALIAWVGMSFFLSNWALDWHRHEQVAEATTTLRSQLTKWDGDDEVTARYRLPGLSGSEVDELIASIDFTKKPTESHDTIGVVTRGVADGESYRIELHWAGQSEYYFDMDMQRAPRLVAAVADEG